MERREFLKFGAGLLTGAAALATVAQAAPIPPISAETVPSQPAANVEPAVVSQDEVDHIKPEQVHWHHRWHRHHWRHRWHRRHWRHRRHW